MERRQISAAVLEAINERIISLYGLWMRNRGVDSLNPILIESEDEDAEGELDDGTAAAYRSALEGFRADTSASLAEVFAKLDPPEVES